MRNKFYFSGLMVGLVFLNSVSFGQNYYYSSEQQIPLNIDSNKFVLKFDESFALFGPFELTGLERIEAILDDPLAVEGFATCSLAINSNYFQFLDSLRAIGDVCRVEPYYVFGDSMKFVILDRFIVAFDSSLSSLQIDSINSLYSASVFESTYGNDNVFVLENSCASGYSTLELANIYYNLPETRYSLPDFRSYIQLFGDYQLYDYYFAGGFQPHIEKIIGDFDSATVWDFAGVDRPVTVAVIDDGVDMFHEDLPWERVLFWDAYNTCEDSVSPFQPRSDGYHGMACAGIIGASHTTDSAEGELTSSGVISLNPNSLILPINLICGDDTTGQPGDNEFSAWASILANAVSYAAQNGADVLSISWGWNKSSLNDDNLNDVISNAYTQGRNGLGLPMFFAAGDQPFLQPDVAYPARLPEVFAVGSIDLDDNWVTNSQDGPSLDIVAPSNDGENAVWSIDQMDSLGWNRRYGGYVGPGPDEGCPDSANNDWNYLCHFGGTSAACPMVAGIASLLISRDSMLTVVEIDSVLRYSAVTDLDWGSITAPDDEYGYGRVDALRAMLAITRGDPNNDGLVAGVGDAQYIINFYIWRGTSKASSFNRGCQLRWICQSR